MLTARGGVPDRVAGLDARGVDSLTKPFSFTELAARTRALLRRGARERPAPLTVGDLTLDPATRGAHRGEAAIGLSAKEFALLEYFMRHPGEVLSRSRLIEHVWDFAYDGGSNIVDVYMRYLRQEYRPAVRRSLAGTRPGRRIPAPGRRPGCASRSGGSA